MRKLSILICSYNEKPYLSEAIESCLAQTGIDSMEIIIGDDGSNDGSPELIEEYCKRYPELIKSYVMSRTKGETVVPSLRVSALVKRGLRLADGDCILVLSGDDYLIGSDRLSRQLALLREHPQLSACYTDFKKVWPDGSEQRCITRASLSRAVFWGSHYVHISCFLFRKEVAEHLLPRFCDDTGLLLSILKQGSVRRVPIMGLAYRQRDKSIMHEADALELAVMELLLYQDALCDGGFACSSLARFSVPLKLVYARRAELAKEKYGKYRSLSAKENNDLLNLFMQADERGWIERGLLRGRIAAAQLLRHCFTVLRRMEYLLSR